MSLTGPRRKRRWLRSRRQGKNPKRVGRPQRVCLAKRGCLRGPGRRQVGAARFGEQLRRSTLKGRGRRALGSLAVDGRARGARALEETGRCGVREHGRAGRKVTRGPSPDRGRRQRISAGIKPLRASGNRMRGCGPFARWKPSERGDRAGGCGQRREGMERGDAFRPVRGENP